MLLFLMATGAGATYYRPGGSIADYRYVLCHSGKPSVCFPTNDYQYTDIYRDNGLYLETKQDDDMARVLHGPNMAGSENSCSCV